MNVSHERKTYPATFPNFIETTNHKLLVEVGSTYSLPAGIAGWTVITFEANPDKYQRLVSQIALNHLEGRITPIYTQVSLHPCLDQFINRQLIGLVKIKAHGHELEILDGLQYSLTHHQIDNLIVNIYPSLRPTNAWIEMIMKLINMGYKAYDFKQLTPFNLSSIHQINKTILLFTTTCI
jgi:hypothetical protein